jgi:Flp pilus assembly protein TadG
VFGCDGCVIDLRKVRLKFLAHGLLENPETVMGIFRRFWSGHEGRKGNVAILFALSIVPLVGATGAAVDYSMANSARTSMQKALDSTALALAKLMPLSQAQLDSQGWQIFQASLGTISVPLQQSDLSISTPGIGRLVLNVSGRYQPAIATVLGIDNFPVGARAEVTWGLKKLELALALDNTGSMASNNKMTELKKAAKNLLTTLESAAKNPGDVKVSIVPFNTQVNIDTSNVNAAWVRWDLWENDNYTCSGSGSSRVCTPRPHSYWTGCVEDRDKDNNRNYDVTDFTPTATNNTKFPAIQCTGSLVTMMPLTYDWTALAAKIDAMNSNGATNVTIGLAWAWHSLTQSIPLTQGAAPAQDLSKYIILMTDGQNTQNRWNGNGSDYCAQCDARTALACTNAKAAGIRLYTIRVIDGNADLLRNCATDPSMYFDVQSASDLTAVFNAIGGQLASLHLSQ